MSDGPVLRLAVCLALVALVAAIYAPVVRYGYVDFDDGLYAYGNPRVRAGLTAGGIGWALTSLESSNWHPATWLSLMLDTTLFGDGPFGHHLVNVVLHAANAVVLFLLLLALTGAALPAALVAFLFAAHPLHVESVAWVAERKDVLSTLLGLASVAAWLGHVRRPSAGRYLAALGLFALSLTAKPMPVTLPFVLLLLDVWPLARVPRWEGPSPVRRLAPLLVEKLPFLALSAGSCTVTFLAQRRGGSVSRDAMLPAVERLANALVSYVRYLGKAVWPVDLAVIYPHPGAGIPAWQAVTAAVLLACATAAAVAVRRRRPWITAGWLFYLGTLVPVIGLVQVGSQAMADRYTYVPLLGIFAVVAWEAHVLGSSRRAVRPYVAIAAVTAVLLLSLLAGRQARLWKDGETLFGHAVAVTAENPMARNNLATSLMARGDVAGAEGQLAEALRTDPGNALLRFNRGLALERLGRPREAVGEYESAVALDPSVDRAWNNLGIQLAREGRLPEAARRFQEGLRANPRNAGAAFNLALALERMGRTEEALAAYARAIGLEPGNAEARRNLGGLLLGRRRFPEARVQIQEALLLDPTSSGAWNALGVIAAEQGRMAEAVPLFTEALRRDPGNAEARANLRRATGGEAAP